MRLLAFSVFGDLLGPREAGLGDRTQIPNTSSGGATNFEPVGSLAAQNLINGLHKTGPGRRDLSPRPRARGTPGKKSARLVGQSWCSEPGLWDSPGAQSEPGLWNSPGAQSFGRLVRRSLRRSRGGRLVRLLCFCWPLVFWLLLNAWGSAMAGNGLDHRLSCKTRCKDPVF